MSSGTSPLLGCVQTRCTTTSSTPTTNCDCKQSAVYNSSSYRSKQKMVYSLEDHKEVEMPRAVGSPPRRWVDDRDLLHCSRATEAASTCSFSFASRQWQELPWPSSVAYSNLIWLRCNPIHSHLCVLLLSSSFLFGLASGHSPLQSHMDDHIWVILHW